VTSPDQHTYSSATLQAAIDAGGDPALIWPERGRIATGMVAGACRWAKDTYGLEVDVWTAQSAYDAMTDRPQTPCTDDGFAAILLAAGVPLPVQLDLFA